MKRSSTNGWFPALAGVVLACLSLPAFGETITAIPDRTIGGNAGEVERITIDAISSETGGVLYIAGEMAVSSTDTTGGAQTAGFQLLQNGVTFRLAFGHPFSADFNYGFVDLGFSEYVSNNAIPTDGTPVQVVWKVDYGTSAITGWYGADLTQPETSNTPSQTGSFPTAASSMQYPCMPMVAAMS